MIDFCRNQQQCSGNQDALSVKIVGVGGAGSNALDRIVLDGVDSANIVALNTDVQSLASSVASEKVQLGRGTTRGLGAGGDPEVGYSATEEAVNEIRGVLKGAPMIFLCVGLGGGTGSGGAPIVAHIAKQQGSLVVVVATLPFGFEGKRRMQQATHSLESLERISDIVICYENDRMGGSIDPRAGIHEAFAGANQTISQSVRALCDVINRPGLINIGFDELSSALRNVNSRSLFGYGEASGANRAHDCLSQALKNPLMDKGKLLAEAHNVLVNVVGGETMTLDEVQILMTELGRHISDKTQILFGTGVDPHLGERMTVTILSSIGLGTSKSDAREKTRNGVFKRDGKMPVASVGVSNSISGPNRNQESKQAVRSDSEDPQAEPRHATEAPAGEEPNSRESEESAPTDATISEETETMTEEKASKVRKKSQETQEVLQFEPVARGRFEKSEPTIIDGQDLDVPTFLRRNVRVK
jgi:cell division protein FtsZ